MNPSQMYELVLLALCNWREARGEPIDAKMAQAWTVRNRALHPSWWGHDWVSVILKPFQYSSFNANDPNASKMPGMEDTSWTDCLSVANEVYAGTGTDPTSGCSHYFDKSLDLHPPVWATDGSMVHVTDIGSFRFYRRS
jgi:N-acetylmuramoyl-L-alanine amidase